MDTRARAARLAVHSGAAGIIVSNHGARQLDYVPATISALSLRPFQLPPPPPRLPENFSPVVLPLTADASPVADLDRSPGSDPPSPASRERIRAAMLVGEVLETPPTLQGGGVRVASVIIASDVALLRIIDEAAINARLCSGGDGTLLSLQAGSSATNARFPSSATASSAPSPSSSSQAASNPPPLSGQVLSLFLSTPQSQRLQGRGEVQ